MKRFNKIMITIIIVIGLTIIGFVITECALNYFFTESKQEFSAIYETYQINPEDYECKETVEENIQSIGAEYDLDFYSGTDVSSEIAKYFSDNRIPDSYQISEGDLYESYALSNNGKPYISVLVFSDEEKFKLVDEFFSYGELFMSYSKRTLSVDQTIIIGNNFDNLEEFTKIFIGQKCYQ